MKRIRQPLFLIFFKVFSYYYKGKAFEGLRRNKEALDTYKLGLEKDKNNEALIRAINELNKLN